MEKEVDINALILVVDDDEDFRDLLCQFLENQGYAVCEAEDGREALKISEKKCPELVLMDADMPRMDGFEACAELSVSPAGKEIPVIIVTGFQDESSVDRAYDVGAVDYVTKPIHWAVLRRRIKNILTFYRNKKKLQEAQDAQKQAEKKLHRAKRMEALGLMAGGVAHDLNNILSGIVGYPELMLMDLPEHSSLREPLEAILDSGKRAATVVADLLTVARGVAGIKKVYDLKILALEYLKSPEFEHLQSLYPDIAYKHQCTATQSDICCSPVHIKKCLMNLVTNATEAIVGNGIVLIKTSNHRIDADASRKYHIKKGDYVVLSIQDTGPGIPEKDRGHIFEPFYTRKVMGRSGSGLGLTVVWNTIQDHNGKILVESCDKGTYIQLYFPVSEKKRVVQNENNTTKKRAGRNLYILVVDDEPQLRDLATRILEAVGYKVNSVCSGELAVEFMKEKKVDLVVIDMLMEPGMNGCRTYEEILKLHPGQKAILASGFSESDDVKAALRLGVGGFIRKPYSMDQLARTVEVALNN